MPRSPQPQSSKTHASTRRFYGPPISLPSRSSHVFLLGYLLTCVRIATLYACTWVIRYPPCSGSQTGPWGERGPERGGGRAYPEM